MMRYYLQDLLLLQEILFFLQRQILLSVPFTICGRVLCPNRVDLGTKPAWRSVGCQDFCTAICCKMVASEKKSRRTGKMKGYHTSDGYMGYVDGKYILFASDKEYFEFMED